MWFQARCETCLAEKSKPHLETHVSMQYVFVFLCALGIRLAPQSQAIACGRHRAVVQNTVGAFFPSLPRVLVFHLFSSVQNSLFFIFSSCLIK